MEIKNATKAIKKKCGSAARAVLTTGSNEKKKDRWQVMYISFQIFNKEWKLHTFTLLPGKQKVYVESKDLDFSSNFIVIIHSRPGRPNGPGMMKFGRMYTWKNIKNPTEISWENSQGI